MGELDYVAGFEYNTVKDRIKELSENVTKYAIESDRNLGKVKIANAEIEVLKAKKELAEFEQSGQEELDKIQEMIDKKTEEMNKLKEDAEKMKSSVQIAADNLQELQGLVNARIEQLKEINPDIYEFMQDTLRDRYIQEMENVNNEENEYKENVKKFNEAKELMNNSEVQKLLSEIMDGQKKIKEIEDKINNTKDEKEKQKYIGQKNGILAKIQVNKDKLKDCIGQDKSINVDELIGIAEGAAEYKKETKAITQGKGKRKRTVKKEVEVIDFDKTLENMKKPVPKMDFESEKAIYSKLIGEIEKQQEKHKQKEEKKKEQYQDGGKTRRGLFSKIRNFFNRNKLPEGRGEQNTPEENKNLLEEKRKKFAESILVKDYIEREAEIRERAVREAARKAAQKRQNRDKSRQGGR